MTFRRKTKSEILTQILSYLAENTELSKNATDYNIGSTLFVLVNALSEQIGGDQDSLYYNLDQVYKSTHINTATGTDLEQIASEFGLTRQTGTKAKGVVTFKRIKPASSDFVISAGDKVATTPQIDENQKVYTVDSNTTFYSSISNEEQLFTNGIYYYPLNERFIDSISEISGTISGSTQVLDSSNYEIMNNYDDYILSSDSDLELLDVMDTNEGWETSQITIADNCDATTGWSASSDGEVNLNNTSGEYYEGTGAIQLDKTGTTTNNVLYSKTLGSAIDLTGKEIQLKFIVTDKTILASSGTAIEVRIGSDSSNYYYKEYNANDFSNNSWKGLKISSTNNTGVTGSPNLTAIDYIAINVNYASSSTTSSNKLRMDYWNYYTLPLFNITDHMRGTGCIGLYKTSTSSASVQFYKTISSTNVYGLDGFIYCNILDEETLNKIDYISIKEGNNSTNKFNNIFYRTDLKVGWNRLYLVNSTRTGNPSNSAVTYEEIEIVTNNDSDTIASGKIFFDWFVFGNVNYYRGDVVDFTGSTYFDNNTNFYVDYVPLSREVNCTSDDVGLDYNVSANKITYLITPNSNITNINNYDSFKSGSDLETDDELRTRIKTNAIGLGLGTETAIKASIENITGIASANVIGTPLTNQYGTGVGVNTKEAHIFDLSTLKNKLDYEMIYLDDITNPTNIIISNTVNSSTPDWIYGTHYAVDTSTNEVIWLDDSNPGTTCPSDGSTYYVGYQHKWIGHIQIYVAGDQIPMGSSLASDVDNAINNSKSAGDIVSWQEPIVVSIDVTASITISTGYSSSSIINNVKSEVNTYINSLGIGDDVYKNKIINTILSVEGVENVSLSSPSNDMSISDSEIAKAGTIIITV